MSNLAKLYAAPLDVARQFALAITGSGAKVREKQTDSEHSLNLLQVYASKPIYAKCRVEGSCLHVEATTDAGGNTQVYFLPWAKGSIYRIRPKTSNASGCAGNLFFTPNLDGCLVRIEGTPDAPTIYHANSAGMQFSEQEELYMKKSPEHAGMIENQLKISNMTSNLKTFQAIPAKNPQVSTSQTAKTKDLDLFEYDKGSSQEILPGKFDMPEIKQVSYYGAVFGVRTAGNWTFYKQSFRIYRHEWSAEESTYFGFGKPQVVRKKVKEYSVINAAQFWP